MAYLSESELEDALLAQLQQLGYDFESEEDIVSGMNVTREDVEVKREWLRPWTAEVSYTEQRSVSMSSIQMQVNTVGEDRVTLVKTLTGGVKIKALHAKTRTLAGAAGNTH
jgi:hypothetical protein